MIAAGHLPLAGYHMFFHHVRFRIFSHGWAYVNRYCIQELTNSIVARVWAFHYQVLFTLGDLSEAMISQELESWQGHFTGDGFVSQVEAKKSFCGFADDPRCENGCVQEW